MVIATEHVDWIQRRVACSSESISLALKKRIKEDVERVNRRITSGVPFVTSGDDLTDYAVHAKSPPNAVSVRFERASDRITIHRKNGPDRIVTWKWIKDSASCELLLDDEPTELWKISQAALYDLFFPMG